MGEQPARGTAGELDALRAQADTRRAARRWVADAVADHGTTSPEAADLRAQLRAVNERWAELIRQAAGAGHTLADVARAAGVAAPSLYYRLRQPPAGTATPEHPPRAGRRADHPPAPSR